MILNSGRKTPWTIVKFLRLDSSICADFSLRISSSDDNILAAAWSHDTCSLAISTAAGGVKIYDLLPSICSDASDIAGNGTSCDALAVRSPAAVLVLRHEIVIKSVSSTPGGNNKASNSGQVHSLATYNSMEDSNAGAAMLIGVAEGRHLCVWDLVSGSTLFTALAIAPDNCKVEKVAWHGPTAMVAVLYAVEGDVRRVDVHQIDVAAQTTTPVRRKCCGGNENSRERGAGEAGYLTQNVHCAAFDTTL